MMPVSKLTQKTAKRPRPVKIILEDKKSPINRKGENNTFVVRTYDQATFLTLIDRFLLESNINGKSRETYRRSLYSFFRWVALTYGSFNGINKETFVRYREHLTSYIKEDGVGYSMKTVFLYFNVAKMFMKFLSSNGLYSAIDFGILKAPRVDLNHFEKQPLTPDKSIELLEVARKRGVREYALILLLLSGALRTVEVHRSRVSDLSVIQGVPVLYIQGKGHSSRDTHIKLSAETSKAIQAYLKTRTDDLTNPNAPLFTSSQKEKEYSPIATRTIRYIVKECLKEIGINDKRYTTHSLRHTAATTALLNGVDIKDVQQFVRHKNINTTQIYIHNLDIINNKCSDVIEKAIFNNGKRKKRTPHLD